MNYVLLDKPYVITFVGESGSGKSSIILKLDLGYLVGRTHFYFTHKLT